MAVAAGLRRSAPHPAFVDLYQPLWTCISHCESMEQVSTYPKVFSCPSPTIEAARRASMAEPAPVYSLNQQQARLPQPDTPPELDFGRHRICMTCPKCQRIVCTETVKEVGLCAMASSLLLCAAMPGLCLLGAVPLFASPFQDVKHYCPACHTRLGIHSYI